MTMRMSARAKFFLYLFLIFMVILTVIPLLYTVSASFKTNMEIATGGINLIPKTFMFDNYKTVWSMSGTGIASKVTYTDYTINSIKVSLMTVVLVVLFTSMSANRPFISSSLAAPLAEFSIAWKILLNVSFRLGSAAARLRTLPKSCDGRI